MHGWIGKPSQRPLHFNELLTYHATGFLKRILTSSGRFSILWTKYRTLCLFCLIFCDLSLIILEFLYLSCEYSCGININPIKIKSKLDNRSSSIDFFIDIYINGLYMCLNIYIFVIQMHVHVHLEISGIGYQWVSPKISRIVCSYEEREKDASSHPVIL